MDYHPSFGHSFVIPESLRCGVESIDSEHDDIYREIASIAQNGDSLSRQDLELSVKQVCLRFKDHLSHEESAMAEVDYPDLNAHIAAHQSYIAKLNDLLGNLTDAKAQKQSIVVMLDQLIREAVEPDMKYVSWLRISGLRHPD